MKVIFFILMTFTSNLVLAEQSLLRLFHSPAERALIELKRQIVTAPTKQAAPQLAQTQQIKVKGYIKRNSQSNTVWLNNVNTLKSNKALSDVKVLKVLENGKVKLRVSGKGIVSIKPGQVLNRDQSRAREAYETGQ